MQQFQRRDGLYDGLLEFFPSLHDDGDDVWSCGGREWKKT
jgi:hypothetical protein